MQGDSAARRRTLFGTGSPLVVANQELALGLHRLEELNVTTVATGESLNGQVDAAFCLAA